MRKKPFISCHKLVEYCYASSTKRNTIIENLLKPKVYLFDTCYPAIEAATLDMLQSDSRSDQRLLELDASLMLRRPSTDHEEARILGAHDAIEFARLMKWPALSDTSLARLDSTIREVSIAGLMVRMGAYSVMTRSRHGQSGNQIGILKPYIGKTFSLFHTGDTNRAALYAALLHLIAERHLNHLGTAALDLCWVGDIFSQRSLSAPKSFLQRRKLLEAAALEIVDRWPSVAARLSNSAREAA